MSERICGKCEYLYTLPKDDSCRSCASKNEFTPREETTFHDTHYQSEHQPIETIQANMTDEEFQGFLKGNILKYVCRCGKKDEALKEAHKIQRYATWLVESLEGKTINPRI